MRVASDAELLRIWELGGEEAPAQRALRLLAAADSDAGEQGAALLSIGRRDARLLELRCAMFGPTLECGTQCPGCRDSLEFSLDAASLFPAAPQGPEKTLRVELAGCEVAARLPTAGDLASLGPEAGARDLLERCLIEVRRNGAGAGARSLEPELVQAIDQRMAEADPLAQLALDLTCPVCGHAWSQSFDILAFFWAEIEAWARRTLLEVHTLASAYGWSESEVLRLGPRRRQFYLELAGP